MTSVSVIVRLLGSIRRHLATHRLPDGVAFVEAGRNALDGEHVKVQVHSVGLPELAAVLLAWADTLTGVTVTAWRPPSGKVHLNLTGRLPDSTRVIVFGGVNHTDAQFGDLQPNGRDGVALSILRTWAAGGSAVAA